MIDWEQVRIQAAISALQGVQESGKLGWAIEALPETAAELAVKMADALVKKLKETSPEPIPYVNRSTGPK